MPKLSQMYLCACQTNGFAGTACLQVETDKKKLTSLEIDINQEILIINFSKSVFKIHDAHIKNQEIHSADP